MNYLTKHLDTLTWNGMTWENVDVTLGGEYEDGSPAIQLFTNGEPLATATVCLAGYRIQPPEGDRVYLKDWSENAGLPAALMGLGLVEFYGDFRVGPHGALVVEARILEGAWS